MPNLLEKIKLIVPNKYDNKIDEYFEEMEGGSKEYTDFINNLKKIAIEARHSSPDRVFPNGLDTQSLSLAGEKNAFKKAGASNCYNMMALILQVSETQKYLTKIGVVQNLFENTKEIIDSYITQKEDYALYCASPDHSSMHFISEKTPFELEADEFHLEPTLRDDLSTEEVIKHACQAQYESDGIALTLKINLSAESIKQAFETVTEKIPKIKTETGWGYKGHKRLPANRNCHSFMYMLLNKAYEIEKAKNIKRESKFSERINTTNFEEKFELEEPVNLPKTKKEVLKLLNVNNKKGFKLFLKENHEVSDDILETLDAMCDEGCPYQNQMFELLKEEKSKLGGQFDGLEFLKALSQMSPESFAGIQFKG